ncbi:MAG: helix-turn-helix domain-containing protein [Blastochloris sp.]|nr:helix-turn-helix domain-containing protein [Blastochloris sp.]
MKTTNQEKSVGEQLKLAREAKDWTLEEAARRTKIKRDTLALLEANAFEKLASLTYARGFIRLYARELGLDGWALLKKLNLGQVAESLSMLELHPDDLESIPKRSQTPVATSQGIGLFVILAVLGIAAIVGLWQLYVIWPDLFPKEAEVAQLETRVVQEAQQIPEIKNVKPLTPGTIPVAQPLSPTPVLEAKPAVPVEQVSKPPEAVPIAAPVAQVAPPAAPETPVTSGNKLQLTANANAADADRWVRVVGLRAGKEVTLFEGTLAAAIVAPSSEQPWIADSFIVTFREASAVEVIYNGTNYGPYPKSGPQRISMPNP